MTDDGLLLRQFAETQSEAAFAELVRRHLSLVYYAALRRLGGDHHAAADVSQGVFILLARKARSLRQHPTLTGWLYSTVNFEVSALLRSARRRLIREKEAGAMLEAEGSDGSIGEGEFLRPVVDEAIMELDKTDREAVLLRFFEGCPVAEVGYKLGLSDAAAQKRILRALEKLRGHLTKRGITSTSAALALAMTGQSGLAGPAALAASIPSAAIIAASMSGIEVGGLSLKIMSTIKLTVSAAGFVAAAAILGVLGAGFGVYRFGTAKTVDEALRKTQSEFAAKREILRDLQQNVASEEKRIAALRSTAAGSESAEPSASNPPKQNPQEEVGKFLAAFPEARGMFAGIFKPDVARAYGPFFRSVEMSPTEIENFEDAVVNSRLDHLGLTNKGFSDTSSVLPSDDQLRSLLGDQRYQLFQDFRQVLPAFDFTNHAAMAAGLAGERLSADQEDQLVRAIVKNSPAPQPGSPIVLGDADWDAVYPQAQALVSPTQWTALEAEFLRMRYGQALAAAKVDSGSPGLSQKK